MCRLPVSMTKVIPERKWVVISTSMFQVVGDGGEPCLTLSGNMNGFLNLTVALFLTCGNCPACLASSITDSLQLQNN